jgi:D-alanine-D-alanine ligase
MKILLLSGGNSNEREVSIRSGEAVAEALEHTNHTFQLADPASTDFNLEELTHNIDVVFLALHGESGEDGSIQKQLEDLDIPFTGSGSKASELCFDKWQFKQILIENNLPAAQGQLVSVSSMDQFNFDDPYVLKPRKGGSCIDTQIVRKPSQVLFKASRELLESTDEMLLEPLIIGVEITVGILGDSALPVIEIIPPEGQDFDYVNRYNGKSQELCPPINISESLQDEAKELALKIHTLTGCKDMSRTDMMVDLSGKLHVLEINTIPGLTKQSLFPKMVQNIGLGMPEFVDKLLMLTIYS